MIKGSIQEEAITIVNMYAPNIKASIYMKQKLIICDFRNPLRNT